MQHSDKLSKQVKAYPARLISVFPVVVHEGVQPRTKQHKREENCLVGFSDIEPPLLCRTKVGAFHHRRYSTSVRSHGCVIREMIPFLYLSSQRTLLFLNSQDLTLNGNLSSLVCTCCFTWQPLSPRAQGGAMATQVVLEVYNIHACVISYAAKHMPFSTYKCQVNAQLKLLHVHV